MNGDIWPYIVAYAREHGGQVDNQRCAAAIVADQLLPDTQRRLAHRIAVILGRRYGCLHIAQGLFKLVDKDWRGA